jgi:hypothetical protein
MSKRFKAVHGGHACNLSTWEAVNSHSTCLDPLFLFLDYYGYIFISIVKVDMHDTMWYFILRALIYKKL